MFCFGNNQIFCRKHAHLWKWIRRRVTKDHEGNILFDEECHDGIPRNLIHRKLDKPAKPACIFYDKMAEHERRIGPREYAKFIINALRGFGINPRQYKRIPDAEEKLYQTVSKK